MAVMTLRRAETNSLYPDLVGWSERQQGWNPHVRRLSVPDVLMRDARPHPMPRVPAGPNATILLEIGPFDVA